MEKFYIRVFLLGYLPAIANEHYQSGFKVFHCVGVELHFVWPLSADLSGMGFFISNLLPFFFYPQPLWHVYILTTGDFYLQPVQLYRSWRHTSVSTTVR